ncbi:ABC transporter permease [Noviherbaspirillum sp. Root189]|uniref:ABC transporter permease n=1 Tax=Noviherbaspirillum sp. Root189 TaxID=1736487 RepID=UPI00070E30D8|nr:ABC transporter permease [Noviherbaspirillum sp. Root189]KRB70558.1 multidrug ABC transporter permease [Noviherbaspirillum sp. Root189]
MKTAHALLALRAIAGREVHKFLRQPGRLVSSMVRPALWLVVFAAGFQNVFGVAIIPPYDTYVEYRVYLLPGLVMMVCLFNGMQSSLAMVYDREMGVMRLLLTAPLPRTYLLACKLAAGTFLSVLQAIAFIVLALLFGVDLGIVQILAGLPVIVLGALMLCAFGLVLSVYIKQLENFAGTMNFVIFPMFFLSSALYPLWKIRESGAEWIYRLASLNPFTHAVEALRFALYGQVEPASLAVVALCTAVFYAMALVGYNPQGSLIKAARPA